MANAGDIVYTLATYSEPDYLTPGETYSTATYPDASAVFGDDDGSFTVPNYTAPDGYNVYVVAADPDWILESGSWNDNGIWKDDEVWTDGP